jgi:lipid A 3-O-deacylase
VSCRAALILMLILTLLLYAATVRAGEPDRSGIQSYALRTAYGIGARDNLKFVSLLPRISLFLPALLDRPLAAHGLQAEFVIEPIASYITNTTDTVEAGVNPLFFSLRYDRGQSLVPFVEGGEGILYTDLRRERLGTRFQFSSQAGGGIDWFLDRTTALTFSYRLRHISNAGIARRNTGLNTDFFTFGVSFFPKR